MVLHNALDVVRRRWKAAVAAALVVALAGFVLVSKQQSADDTETSMTQIGVAGPLRELEYYSLDLNAVAADVVSGVSTYLTSDVTLRKIRAALPRKLSYVQLRTMIDVEVLPSSIIDIRASHPEPEIARLTVQTLQKESLELVERFGEQRFEGDSPLTTTILIDTTAVEVTESSPLVLIVLYAVLALIAAGAAAFLREVLDARVRTRADTSAAAARRADVVEGGARVLRAELDLRGARTILVVTSDAPDVSARGTDLVAAFRETGETCGALLVGGADAHGEASTRSSLPDAAEVAAGDTLVLDEDAAAAALTADRLAEILRGLAGADGRVVAVAGGAADDPTFHLLRRSTDAVVVVAEAGATRKHGLRSMIREISSARADRGGEFVWLTS